MMLALYALGIISVLELALYVPVLWLARKPLAIICVALLSLITGAVFAARPSVATGLLLVANLYRIFNLLRVTNGRMQAQFLYQATRTTTITLLLVQIAVLLAWRLSDFAQVTSFVWWMVAGCLQLMLAAVLFMTTQRHLRTTMPLAQTESYGDHDLPSITVCLPARNETSSLEESLRSLIASDYPKLEVLVLDDCSQDKTSDIIRNFAHAGVRFIKGTVPPTKWMAKNWAYQQLYEQANGEILVFCGVDIRFEPSSIRTIITTLLTKRKTMLCIIPQNIIPAGFTVVGAALLQPVRYAWELCLPRRYFKRPPVLSSCWAITRTQLDEAGSFAAVSNGVVPESYFAKSAIKTDGYSFVRSGGELAITSLKTISDQWETAVRTRYAQLHKKPELVLVMTLLELFSLVFPAALLVVGLAGSHRALALLSGLATLLLYATYARVVTVTYRHFMLGSLAALPFAILLNIYIRHESMWRYEFGEVNWKGRNVCLPVMRIIPRLPKI